MARTPPWPPSLHPPPRKRTAALGCYRQERDGSAGGVALRNSEGRSAASPFRGHRSVHKPHVRRSLVGGPARGERPPVHAAGRTGGHPSPPFPIVPLPKPSLSPAGLTLFSGRVRRRPAVGGERWWWSSSRCKTAPRQARQAGRHVDA